MGGDEFLVVLQDFDEDEIQRDAQKVKAVVVISRFREEFLK